VVAGKVANANITGTTLTIGAPVYLSLTAGEVDDTAPSATGDVVAEVGIAYTTTAFLLQVKAPIVLT